MLFKIFKTIATSSLKECTKSVFGWGSAPGPAGGAYSAPPERGAYSAPPDSLAGLRGTYFYGVKGREGERGKGRGGGKGCSGRRRRLP